MDGQIDYKQLLMAIGDGVVVADADGKIVFWNPGATRIFGFSDTEAIGQTLDLIVPERQRQRHWGGFEKTMQTGQTRYGNELLRVPALHKEGHPLSIAFTVAMLHTADGKVSAIVAIVRDETARWNEERELRGRVKELEAKGG
ncbi:MAG: PAS domain-containing protein [Pseudomonadota bacterium]|nr:PAS domain-containing protein [Pseudomonadota bacterium]